MKLNASTCGQKKWDSLDSGNKSRVLNPDDLFVMSSYKKLDEVLLRVLTATSAYLRVIQVIR